MIGSEERYTTPEERKAKIRKRYKGIDPNELDVIPAIKPADFYSDKSNKRVAVYARVSTDDPNQTSSYELQKAGSLVRYTLTKVSAVHRYNTETHL